MKKIKENIFGVKVGDIFCFKLEFITYFQVVALRGKKQIIVREIEQEIVDTNEGNLASYEKRVMPVKNKFTETTFLLSKKRYTDEKNDGCIKTVSLNYDNIPQLDNFGCSTATCYLWDGKSNISSSWSALCR